MLVPGREAITPLGGAISVCIPTVVLSHNDHYHARGKRYKLKRGVVGWMIGGRAY